MQVYGNDYPTADGTCVRDYIHVDDLCSAHLLALNALMNGASSNLYNCGYGHGFSVKEVLETVQKVSGKTIPYTIGPRRAGDSPAIVADSEKIRRELGWKPKYDDLELICKTAFEWERKLQEKMSHSSA
jgi:UDP-glucose 4-epimerase